MHTEWDSSGWTRHSECHIYLITGMDSAINPNPHTNWSWQPPAPHQSRHSWQLSIILDGYPAVIIKVRHQSTLIHTIPQPLSSKPTINHVLSSFTNPNPYYTTAVIIKDYNQSSHHPQHSCLPAIMQQLLWWVMLCQHKATDTDSCCICQQLFC